LRDTSHGIVGWNTEIDSSMRQEVER
jgi:hypothetical protein